MKFFEKPKESLATYVVFNAKTERKVARLPISDNKSHPEAKKTASEVKHNHTEYTYRLDNLLAAGSIDIKTNFRMR